MVLVEIKLLNTLNNMTFKIDGVRSSFLIAKPLTGIVIKDPCANTSASLYVVPKISAMTRVKENNDFFPNYFY